MRADHPNTQSELRHAVLSTYFLFSVCWLAVLVPETWGWARDLAGDTMVWSASLS